MSIELCSLYCISPLEKGLFLLTQLFICYLQIELATGKFPYSSWGTPFEQLKQVVKDDPPRLPAGKFTPEFDHFIEQWYAHYAPN